MLESKVDARLIGIIGKPHGIRGEVVIKLLTDYPKTIKKGDILFFDERCMEKVEVEDIKFPKANKTSDFLIIKFKDIDSKNDVVRLRGANIFRSIKNTPLLEKDQYWIDDIINCKVYNKSGVFIGSVIDIEKFIANDNLVVRIENKELNIQNIDGDIFYVPVIKDYIEDIDPKSKKVILKRIPEYI